MITELIIKGDFTIEGKGVPDMKKHLKYLKLSTRILSMIGIDSFSSVDSDIKGVK